MREEKPESDSLIGSAVSKVKNLGHVINFTESHFCIWRSMKLSKKVGGCIGNPVFPGFVFWFDLVNSVRKWR